jgi:chromosome segregation ATPase
MGEGSGAEEGYSSDNLESRKKDTFRPMEAQLIALPGESHPLRGIKPRVVARYPTSEFQKVLHDHGDDGVLRRRMITPDGKEYEYHYDYSYCEEEPEAPGHIGIGQGVQVILDQFPKLHSPTPSLKRPASPRRKRRNSFEEPELVPFDVPGASEMTNEELAAQLEKLRTTLRHEKRKKETVRTQFLGIQAATQGQTLGLEKTVAFLVEPTPLELVKPRLAEASSQTLSSAETIREQEAVIETQRKQIELGVEVEQRASQIERDVAEAERTIKESDESIAFHNGRIEELRLAIAAVREELEEVDRNAMQEDHAADLVQIEIQKVKVQKEHHNERYQKLEATAESLQKQLEEMIRMRAVLESELEDLRNREKPEVRQLMDEVRSAKQQIDAHNASIRLLQNGVDEKREELKNVKDSPEMRQLLESRLKLADLERKSALWEVAPRLPDGPAESHQMVERRIALKAETSRKEAQLFRTQDEVESLHRYAELIDSIVGEGNS